MSAYWWEAAAPMMTAGVSKIGSVDMDSVREAGGVAVWQRAFVF